MNFIRLYARVLGLLAADRQVALGLALSAVALAGLQFLEPVLFGRVIDLLSRSIGMTETNVWAEAAVLLAIWAMVGLSGIGANVAVSLLADRMAHRNRLKMMSRYFEHVLSLPLAFHGDVQSGRLMKVMLVGADNLFGMWLSFFREHLITFIGAIVLLPLTLFLNWRLAIVLIILVVITCAVTIYVIRKTQAAQMAVERFHTQLAGNAQDALSNVMVVQSFTRMRSETKMFSDIMRQVLDHQFPVLNWWAVVNVLTRAAATISTITIFVFGTVLHLRGQATVGEIVSFMGFATLLVARLEGAVGFVSHLLFQAPSLTEFFQVLDTRSTVPEGADALDIPRAEGHVRFENVGFSYPGGGRILSAIDFEALPGRTIALVGQTGAGKSTAMALMQRLWDPVEGRVTLDGHDLRDIKLEALRRNVGVVFQESFLFNRTIRDNLLVGRPDATQAEIEQACRMAEAHDFITRQPHGYDTLVGEWGVTLSGGERQRIALARALLVDAPILVLDEATSALDLETEAEVLGNLAAEATRQTRIVVAHRPASIASAGRVVAIGNPPAATRSPVP